MRSIETILKENKHLTGAEILAIHKQEKEAEEKEINERLKDARNYIKDLENNGAYFKGTFGLHQKYFHHFSNFKWDGEKVYCTILKIVCFFTKENEISIEIRESKFEDFDRFEIWFVQYDEKENYTKRIKQDEFNKALTYAQDMAKLWD